MRDIERNIRGMQNDMTKLNTLITQESGLREALQQGTVLMESDFIQALKVTHYSNYDKPVWPQRLPRGCLKGACVGVLRGKVPLLLRYNFSHFDTSKWRINFDVFNSLPAW